MSLSPDCYWLALRRVRGVGPRTARLLLDRFGAAEQVFHASERELLEVGLYRSVARNLLEFRDFEPLEKELCEIKRLGAKLVRWTDAEYPLNLKEIADPPPLLYVRGELAPGLRNCVAVVGARAASDGGRHMARRLGLELAAKELAVVSGLARGIDGEAHRGALDANGRTIAVLGCGIDVVYPTEHRLLANDIVDHGGAIISELPLGTSPMAENFPARNRILAGLCLGVVVVEAAEKSGSLITARLALEQNREVFAVPGSPLTGKARGSNRLLREGARLVECVEDVLEELAPQLSPAAKVKPAAASERPSGSRGATSITATSAEPKEADLLLKYLKTGEKLHVDSIIEHSGLSAQQVLRLLLELELTGMVSQHPGKLFSLRQL